MKSGWWPSVRPNLWRRFEKRSRLGNWFLGKTNLEKLELRGLMTMPAPDQDEIETRRVFARLREMQERLKSELNAPQIDQLSMGMTSDFAWAILEGATMIRVGSAIFGARQ